MIILYAIIALAILLFMIVIHEFGHYVAGKTLGFRISEFSIGFGPKIVQKTLKNGEKFTLRAIPLGGYCAFFDEDGTGNATDSDTKSFVAHAPWKRIVVFVAGAFFNFVSAIIFAFIFIIVVGYSLPQVGQLTVDPDKTPLRTNDIIIAVQGKDLGIMYSWDDAMKKIVGDDAQFELTVLRQGQDSPLVLTVRRQEITQEDGQSYVGIGFGATSVRQNASFLDAVGYSFPLTLKYSGMIIGAFGQMITGQIPLSQMTGPISTVTSIAQFATVNAQVFFMMLPLIAANLAIFNLLPIPALDGSKVVFTGIEWIRGKPIKRELEGMIHFVGFVILLGAMLLLEFARIFL